MAQYYFYRVNGKIFGPVRGRLLHDRLERGILNPAETEVRREDKDRWIPAEKLRVRDAASSDVYRDDPSPSPVPSRSYTTRMAEVDDVHERQASRSTVSGRVSFAQAGEEAPPRRSEPEESAATTVSDYPLTIDVEERYRWTRAYVLGLKVGGVLVLVGGVIGSLVAAVILMSEAVLLLGPIASVLIASAFFIVAELIQMVVDIGRNGRTTNALLLRIAKSGRNY